MCHKHFENRFTNKQLTYKMFLNWNFHMEKFLAREATVFPEKNKSLNILLKFIQPTPHCKKSLPGFQTFEFSRQISQNPKLKSFGLSPLPMQNPYSKTFLHSEFFICKPIFKIFAAHFRTLGMLNHDKIILVWGWYIAWWYAKTLILKDVA